MEHTKLFMNWLFQKFQVFFSGVHQDFFKDYPKIFLQIYSVISSENPKKSPQKISSRNPPKIFQEILPATIKKILGKLVHEIFKESSMFFFGNFFRNSFGSPTDYIRDPSKTFWILSRNLMGIPQGILPINPKGFLLKSSQELYRVYP